MASKTPRGDGGKKKAKRPAGGAATISKEKDRLIWLILQFLRWLVIWLVGRHWGVFLGYF